jgi:hypothetical protein
MEALLMTTPPTITKVNVGDNVMTAEANLCDNNPANDHCWLQMDDIQLSTTTTRL